MIEIVVLIAVVAILVITTLLGYQSWNGTICPTPIIQPASCPPCPGGSSSSGTNKGSDCGSENTNLKEMVRYLTLVIKKYEAEQELYKLSNGYHQVYNSPKLEYLRKEISRTIAKIKATPDTAAYFEQNLSYVV